MKLLADEQAISPRETKRGESGKQIKMTRQRMRIRFRKEGDLRLISHRDLARLCERMFRRAGLRLAMSEGFHPKAKLSFPSALGLGIAGLDEVLEVELIDELAVEEVTRRLTEQAPPGLTIHEMTPVPEGTRKAQVQQASYEISIPPEHQVPLGEALAALLAETSHWHTRPDRKTPVDIRGSLVELELRDDRLCMTLRHCQEGSVRPRDVLNVS